MPKFVTLLAFFTLVAVTTAKADQVPQDIIKLTERFHKTMVICPDRIWADYSWSGLRVLFAYPHRQNSYLWDVSTNSIQEVRNEKLSPSAVMSSFIFMANTAGSVRAPA